MIKLKTGDIIELSIAFRGEKEMQALNKKYRHKDYIPDILAFPELNEILICLSLVKKNAKKKKLSMESELSDLISHGVMNLLK